ncbi:hypothetical protein C0Q70_05662 [Pomacea canaliculata]|uniref:EF-hand domain-containing protein n=1 Tax=Pomacea canaliculata TaxID=400727 RepID=A0A2T7PLU8_POMCA|nr:hypothetical protein C0Q70_05662 [Pomacea canaliculata]
MSEDEREVPLDVSCLPSNLSSCTESEAKLALVDRHLHGTLVMSEMVSGNVEEPTSAVTTLQHKAPAVTGKYVTYSRAGDMPDVTASHRTYRRAAVKLGVVPQRAVIGQFGRDFLTFRDLGLTLRELKATCLALMHERQARGLDVSGNTIGAHESEYVIAVLTRISIQTLDAGNNCLTGTGLRRLSDFVSNDSNLTWLNLSRKNRSLQELELRWNHIRRIGAICVAKGLEVNQSLQRVDLAWNGFGFEGCVALGDALARNHVMRELDLTCNRIHPPALLELVRGLVLNKTLRVLKIGNNPITASFTSVLMNSIHAHPTVALELLDMEGVVVDRDFQAILDDVRKTRHLQVNYDIILPVKSLSREEMLRRIQAPGAYNLDPLHMFYLLKEKMRASDFFHKINKDNNEGVCREELNLLFQEAGIPVTGSVIDKIISFMDTNGDGTIDISEFMTGDKKMKRLSRNHAKNSKAERKQRGENFTRYSRSFKQAHVDPVTLAVKVDDSATQLPSVGSPEDGSRPAENN